MFIEIFQTIATSGIWLLFFLVLLEGNPFIGSFIPGQVLIIIVGIFLATIGDHSILFYSIIIGFAALIGDLIGYYIGKNYGNRALKFMKIKKNSKFFHKTENFFNKYGIFSIILGRQFNLTRSFIPFFAGMSEMRFKKFFPIAIFSCFSWSFISFYLGYSFGYVIIEKMKFIFEFITFLIIYSIIMVYLYKNIVRISFIEKNEIKRKNLQDLLFFIILIFFIVIFLLFNEFGINNLINMVFSNLNFSYFRENLNFIFSKTLILILFLILFLIAFFSKKIYLIIIYIWSSFFFIQFSFIVSLIIKRVFEVKLYFSILIYSLLLFFIFLTYMDFMKKRCILKKSKKYFKAFLFILIILLLLIKASKSGGDFYLVLISFLIGSLGCEILNIMSHYGILHRNISINIRKE